MNLAGYLVHKPGGPLGYRGVGYTYVLAGNGLFLEAGNPLLRARIPLAFAEVRGLLPLAPYVELCHGTLLGSLLSLAIDSMTVQFYREMYAAIVWSDGYRLVIPGQEQGDSHVTYEVPPGIVVGIHSHGTMEAFFSDTDDRDDQGFLVSVVVGRLDSLFPRAKARLCVYGYFVPVRLSHVFDHVPQVLEEPWNTG